MQHITQPNIPSSRRLATVHSGRPSSPGDSLEDTNSDTRSSSLLHDTDSLLSETTQTRQLGLYDREHDGLSVSSRQRRIHMLRNWKWEALSMVVSQALLVAIIVTLAMSNHGTLPEWPYNININSIISVFTTIIIAQLGFILAEIISQLKWVWFNQPHQLQDLEHYDAASRGIIGSVVFLTRFSWQPRAFLAVGAVFTLLMSAAIGPFAQQSIKSYACQRPLHNISASVAAASYVEYQQIITQPGISPLDTILSFKMKTAALEGIVALANNSRTVPFECPTGACDFPPYSSLGYCSSCVDITSHVEEQHGPYGLDQGYFDQERFTVLNYTIPGEDCELEFFVDSDNPGLIASFYDATTHLIFCFPELYDTPANFTTLSLSWSNCSQHDSDDFADGPGCGSHPKQLPSLGNSSGLLAMNCTLGLCVRDYTGRVRNGVLEETLTSSQALADQVHEYESTLLKLPCIIDSEEYDVSNLSQVPSGPGRQFTTINLDGQNVTAPLECVFGTESIVSFATSGFLRGELFQPQSGVSIGHRNERPTCSFDSKMNISRCNPWYLEPMFRRGRFTAENISSCMDRIADAISNQMRAFGSNAYRNGSGTVLGTVIQMTVCVRVDWPWLLLPGALVLLTMVLLVAVLFMARPSHDGQPIWKSSALVAFFHGIDARSHTPVRADGGTTRPVESAHETENPPISSSSLRGENHEDLMTLESMHARAKKVVVKLDTTEAGRRGFIMVNKEEDAHLGVSNNLDGQRRSTGSHRDGEALPSTQLPSNSSVHTQSPGYLQVDLGIGLSRSIRGSLESLTQQDPER